VLTRARRILGSLLRRRQFEDAMAEEMRFHLAARADDLVRSGLTADEARRCARLEFGDIHNAKLDCRESRGLRMADDLGRDLRYAIRLLIKAPAFTATALATLAICLGANLTIFAVVDGVLLRPLPFPDADRLVSIYNTYPGAGVMNDGCSLANYYERRGSIPALAAISIYQEATAAVGEPGATDVESIVRVSPDFFATLGSPPASGRAFDESETSYGTDGVAILTHSYWKERLNGRGDVVGSTIRYNGARRVIVGVLPQSFWFLSSKARIFVPLSSEAGERALRQRHSGSSRMIARLAPGVTLEAAQAQIDTHNARMLENDPYAQMMKGVGFRSIAAPLHASHAASARSTLILMQAGALALLLIAAANLVNLLLIRASGRAKELVVRRALGAGRRHVVGEVIAETSLLALAGGLFGMVAGAVGIRLLVLLDVAQLPLGAQIRFDARVVAAALAGALILGLIMALPIAWYYLRVHASAALQLESRGSTVSRAAQRLRHAFLIAQIAMAFVLVASAGLLGISLHRATMVSPGFRAGNVLTGLISLRSANFVQRRQFTAFAEALVERLEQEPGVASAAIATNIPLSGRHNKSAAVPAAEAPVQKVQGHYSYGVAGNYFATLGIPLREGRLLTSADSQFPARVAVVDEDFARRYWPHASAVGERIFQGTIQGPEDEAFTIVGVVGAARQAELTEDGKVGAVYYPFAHQWDSQVFVLARTSLPATSLGSSLRQAVRGMDQDLPVTDLMTMAERIKASTTGRRSPAVIAVLFSAIAVLLAAIGTYGVLSYAVAQRRREIGLRMALGARPGQIRAQFLSMALRALIAGSAIGLAGALGAGRAMESLLYGVPAMHGPTLALSAVLLLVVALPACLLPALRASRISPLDVLSE
jgi:predicted permease